MGLTARSSRRRTRLGWSDWLLLAEAVVSVGVASLVVAIVPFRRIVRPDRTSPTASPRRDAVPRLVWAVNAASRRVPWRAVCFQRAVGLKMMLRRRGIASVLHYGIARDGNDKIKAHVWLSVGEDVLIGGREASQFACVGSFPA